MLTEVKSGFAVESAGLCFMQQWLEATLLGSQPGVSHFWSNY